MLDALDQTLIPGAQNAERKALLQGARPAFAAHLERAKQVQKHRAGPDLAIGRRVARESTVLLCLHPVMRGELIVG